jgi:outer membrane protein TolC
VSADSFPEQAVSAARVASLDSLQALALQTNPRLTERRAMVAVQAAQTALAAREHLPDFDVTLQYGQRDRLPDMITAMISVPIPVQRARKQSGIARGARFDLAAAEAELRAEENAVRSEIARAYALSERYRANLALLERAILPQSRATFASASATYQAGRGELLGVLDAMRAQFATEMMYVRALADFAKSLAALETLVGREVTP